MGFTSTGLKVRRFIGLDAKVGTPVVTVLSVDKDSKVLLAKGATVPTAADAGYAKGCLFIDTSASAGSVLFVNGGSETSAAFTSLDDASSSSHNVIAAGEFTTAGGDATESITVSGALATDLVHVTMHTVGASPVTILTALAVSGAITVTTSADPSTDHVFTYSVLRAA